MHTGVKGLDELIEGGIPRGSVTLISGAPGTGKTLFCLQVLANGCREGEKGLLVSFEQKEKDILAQAERFNWGIKELVDSGMLKLHYVDILAEENVFDTLRNEVTNNGVRRLAIDSLTALQNYPAMLRNAEKLHMVVNQSEKLRWVMHEDSIKRMMIHYLIEALKDLPDTTALLISDIKEDSGQLSSDGISDFLADGIILMSFLGIGESASRSLYVRKMRETKHSLEVHSLEISPDGLTIKSSDDLFNK